MAYLVLLLQNFRFAVRYHIISCDVISCKIRSAILEDILFFLTGFVLGFTNIMLIVVAVDNEAAGPVNTISNAPLSPTAPSLPYLRPQHRPRPRPRLHSILGASVSTVHVAVAAAARRSFSSPFSAPYQFCMLASAPFLDPSIPDSAGLLC